MKKLLLLCVLLTSASLSAQNRLKIEYEMGSQKNLEAGGVIYVQRSTNVNFKLDFTCDVNKGKNVEKSKITLHVGDEEYDVASTLKMEGDSAHWTFSKDYTMNEVRQYAVSAELLFYNIENENDTINIDTISSNTLKFETLRPVVAAPAFDDYYLFVGKDSKNLNPVIAGGYGSEADWDYAWNNGEKGKTMKVEPGDNSTYILTAINLIDGKEWEKKEIAFKVHTFEMPTLEISYDNSARLQVEEFGGTHYVEAGAYDLILTLEVQDELVPAITGSMTFKSENTSWDSHDFLKGLRITQKYNLERGTSSFYGTAKWLLKQQKRTHVKDDMSFEIEEETVASEEIFSPTLSFNVASAELKKMDYRILVDDPFTIIADYGGGSGDWRFTLDGKEERKDLDFSIERAGAELHTLTVTNYINDVPWFTKPMVLTINAYAEPKVTIEGSVDTVICYPHKPQFIVIPEGGYADGWTYEWYRDDKLINGHSNVQSIEHVYNERDEEVTVLYKAIAKIQFDGKTKEWKSSKSINVHQYATPFVDDNKLPQKTNRLFIGDEYNFKDSIQYGIHLH